MDGLSIEADSTEVVECRSAGLVVDIQMQKVTFAGRTLAIRGLTYKLLIEFLLSERRVLSTSELAERVWKKSYVSDETIAQRISLLRKSLSPMGSDLIESVRSEGYRWLAPVELNCEPAAAKASLSSIHSERKRLFVVFATLTILVALFVWFVKSNTPQESQHNVLNEHPLLLQKAFEFAEQNNATSNTIATDLFTEFLTKEPDNIDAHIGLATAYIERFVKFQGEELFLDFAAELIDKLVEMEAPEWQISRLKAYYHDAKGEIDQAIFYYEKSLEQNEEEVHQIAASLAYLYVRKGRLYESLQLNLTVLDAQQGYTVLQIAEILYLSQSNELSKRWVQLAYKLAPNDAFVVTQYAKDFHARGSREEAYLALEKLHSFNLGTAFSYTTLAELAIKDERWELADHSLQIARNLDQDYFYSQTLHYWLFKKGYAEDTVPLPPLKNSGNVWPNWYIARSVAEIADTDYVAAKRSIASAISEGYLDYDYLKLMPVFSPLIGDPDFESLVNQMIRSVSTERIKINTSTLPDPNLIEQAI
ncbi:hypothetical protein CWE22_07435 [Pseudidiomarina aestuarii]|uniref:OmpR/PhoB-type domain-containing protein n=1 Tax=Pseudidiomarina aestuarii TaxID=624146 RepID=A0A7Z6ZV93_9GAMM|nr:winged helix-turn-helix domain-containing protein [Pseudidiomarina aestuarii]RUO41966.1 hypothetical protein CWE22_07435 [Pseudidiomarina aestuarii]